MCRCLFALSGEEGWARWYAGGDSGWLAESLLRGEPVSHSARGFILLVGFFFGLAGLLDLLGVGRSIGQIG